MRIVRANRTIPSAQQSFSVGGLASVGSAPCKRRWAVMAQAQAIPGIGRRTRQPGDGHEVDRADERRVRDRGQLRRRSTPIWTAPSVWVAVSVGAVVVAWAVASVLFPAARLVTPAPRPQVAVAATTACAALFAALVLALFPKAAAGRLRWVSAGLAVLAAGGLGFGNLWPMLVPSPAANASMYAALAVWGLAGTLLAVGLLPKEAPPFTVRTGLLLAIGGVALAVTVLFADSLPRLFDGGDPWREAVLGTGVPLAGLTAWYWIVSPIPLLLAVIATVGVVRRCGDEAWRGWLAAALTLLAGAQLHNALWPSAYSAVLTSSSVLFLAFAAVVAVGGVIELHRFAAERTALLAAAQEHAAALSEIESMRSDFTQMVAHELGSPIAAIHAWLAVLEVDELRSEIDLRVFDALREEADRLQRLIADVRAIATVEHADFAVRRRSVSITDLLAAASSLNRSLPGSHPMLTAFVAHENVLADPDRIGQVLRNLLGNAAKYAGPGSPIELRTKRHGNRIRIEIVDHGSGIAPGDEARIFEKYGRGTNQRAAGTGLGLYLSRRIVEAHGSELTLTPTPGGGATFAFELELDHGWSVAGRRPRDAA